MIIAPPQAGGFFAGGLIGQRMDQARADTGKGAKAQPAAATTTEDGE